MNILKGLEPAPVFEHFEAICAIPHGSRNTKAVSDYCVDVAQKLGLRYRQDESNNVVIWKPGTTGYENAAPVMIQGHLDMVCEKDADCDLDMEREGLRLRLEDGILSADGTTLGGDDGIAVAYALALLESTDIPHPPLEVVLTVDEEIGMLGAEALDMSDLQSRIMLNLDSEQEGELLVSCAGGLTAVCHVPVERESVQGVGFWLELSGCTGGHSGAEIHRGSANASVLLGRCLYRLGKQVPFALVSVAGGDKDNAIPRAARAALVLPADGARAALEEAVNDMERTLRAEYAATDPSLTLTLTERENDAPAMTQLRTRRIITALMNLPAGVQKMSSSVPGMVQTSLNLGVLRTFDREVSMTYCVRSSVESEKLDIADLLACLTEELGGRVEVSGDYPGWAYREDSPLRETMVQVYERLYGEKPLVRGMHAGVECGLFASRLPGLDCVSFGPDMEDIHTPRERLSAESARRTWEFTLAVLKELR